VDTALKRYPVARNEGLDIGKVFQEAKGGELENRNLGI
jgi:hypothetical protein